MLIDYHLHNHFSPDSNADTREMLLSLQKREIRHVCFTNHAEWFTKGEGKPGVFDEYEAMRRFETIEWELEALKPEFPDMDIRMGVELDYQPHQLSEVEAFLKNTPLDYVLGCVHTLDGIVVATNKNIEQYFDGKTEEEAYTRFFAEQLKLIEWGKLDGIAHFDLIKKYGHQFYGPFKPENHEEAIKQCLKAIKDRNMAIELNTSCLEIKCNELFPHPTILKWAVEIGIEHFTLSSDAHAADTAGKHAKKALEIAKEVGIQALTTYEKRQAKKIEI